jgi:hypothetical protein
MIEFDLPPFGSFRPPRYRREGGPARSAVASGFPSPVAELRRLIQHFPDCRRAERAYVRLQFLSWFTAGCATFSLVLGLLAWRYFRFTVLLPNALALAAIAIVLRLLADLQFRRLADLLAEACREHPEIGEQDDAFRHYDVTPHGIFRRTPSEAPPSTQDAAD